jgi:hypothetical protein
MSKTGSVSFEVTESRKGTIGENGISVRAAPHV